MKGLRVIVDASCIFHKDYIYNRDWNSNLGTNFGINFGKCSKKLFSDIVVRNGIFEILNINF